VGKPFLRNRNSTSAVVTSITDFLVCLAEPADFIVPSGVVSRLPPCVPGRLHPLDGLFSSFVGNQGGLALPRRFGLLARLGDEDSACFVHVGVDFEERLLDCRVDTIWDIDNVGLPANLSNLSSGKEIR
jgi:hypothetical protein